MSRLSFTSDGSHTLLSQQFGVDYHSTHGAIQESKHVFLKHGLMPLLEKGQRVVEILEMGFGTGLNALVVRQLAEDWPGVQFNFTTFELYPVTETDIAGINYPALMGVPLAWLTELHAAEWEVPVEITPNVSLRKLRQDFLTATPRPYPLHSFDVIFYDAFAPRSQPEFWTQDAMRICLAALRPGGVFVTYCAKGQFKRDLRDAGFQVEALPGPPGKREMTRGRVVSL
ncbi:MAG: tRNA (5-methylaminomethyl-2-thiouridine)(34)-methyltransferase MnmD [Lewinella sp.]